VHAFRHFAAMIFLRENPGEYETHEAHRRLGEPQLDGSGVPAASSRKTRCAASTPSLIVTARTRGIMILRPHIADWPTRDRALWDKVVAPKGLFDSGGASANWSEASRLTTARGYGAGIASWIAFYTNRRPHQGLGHRTPMSIWRLGTTGALDDTAVDNMPTLDVARAAWGQRPRSVPRRSSSTERR
jgi:hypothetical protein